MNRNKTLNSPQWAPTGPQSMSYCSAPTAPTAQATARRGSRSLQRTAPWEDGPWGFHRAMLVVHVGFLTVILSRPPVGARTQWGFFWSFRKNVGSFSSISLGLQGSYFGSKNPRSHCHELRALSSAVRPSPSRMPNFLSRFLAASGSQDCTL